MTYRPLLVARIADRGMLARIVRAALVHEVAHVPLAEPPRGSGLHTLQLKIPNGPSVSLSAEPAGSGATNAFPLRLRPLNPSHVVELTRIAQEEASLISLAPVSASASAIFDLSPPLPQATRPPPEEVAPGRGPTATLPDPESEPEEGLDQSVLFDPEAALISRAPPRAVQAAGADDTLTVPLRASMVPAPPLPGGHAKPLGASGPSGSRPPSPQRLTAPPAQAAPPPHPLPPRTSETSEPSIHVTVDTASTTLVRTERNVWRGEGDVPDPSLAASVVIDPDVMRREQRVSARPPAAEVEHPADSDGISVVFGNEPTRPGEDVDPKLVGVVVRQPAAKTDPSVTRPSHSSPSTERRRPEVEDGTIEPTSNVISSSRGPRTQKRAHVDVVAGRVIANKYRVESLVGTGSVGAVYRASHTELARTVALKVLHPHYRADPHLMHAFRTEARAASLLHHPNVTVVHDLGEEPDGLVYIVMEFLSGWTVQALLDRDRRLDPKRALDILLQVCAALVAAHEQGIVHRDVKPDNVVLIAARDDEGQPFELAKVCDFGIAALETAPPTDAGYTAGTPEYMAPEQAVGRADARTDVYACGILLYEMLTGSPPFTGESPLEILKKHAAVVPRRPSELVPGISPFVDKVVLHALEKQPERRFQTMRELRLEVKRLLGYRRDSFRGAP